MSQKIAFFSQEADLRGVLSTRQHQEATMEEKLSPFSRESRVPEAMSKRLKDPKQLLNLSKGASRRHFSSQQQPMASPQQLVEKSKLSLNGRQRRVAAKRGEQQ